MNVLQSFTLFLGATALLCANVSGAMAQGLHTAIVLAAPFVPTPALPVPDPAAAAPGRVIYVDFRLKCRSKQSQRIWRLGV